MMIFSKHKMIERLTKEGHAHMITPEITKIMDMLDGKEAQLNRYKALVLDEVAFDVYYEGKYYPVNHNDCYTK